MSQLIPSAIAQTASRLEGIVNRTPVITSRILNQRTGYEIFLKCENFQRVGAFKFRGAYNAVSQLSDTEKAAGVITHSSGNHAQGLALAARLHGIRATIVMPHDAPTNKRAATADYGAHIVTCDAVDREKISAELVAQQGYTLIHPYDNDHIILGQGTAAFELIQEVGHLDGLFVPVGGGGLISGSALAAAAESPGCQVIGVEPVLAADANRSWREKQIVTLETVPPTIADGLRTRFIGTRNLTVMNSYVHDMTTVSEQDILETLEFIWTYLKIIVEPSAAVALAPLFSGKYQPSGRRIGVILSGGNINVGDFDIFQQPQAINVSTPTETEQRPLPETQTPQRPRILITDPLDDTAVDILRKVAEVNIKPDMGTEEMLKRVRDYEILIVGPHHRIGSQTLKYGFKLQAIATPSSRLDNIDVSTARAMGIQVINVPDGNAVAIAEHTLARLMMLITQFGDGRLSGKTLGLIGFGSVGQQVAQRARAFDMQILINQPRLTPELVLDVDDTDTDLVELLQQSDFVSLHVPSRAQAEAIIGEKELGIMKSSAMLINSGHTDLIDEAALLSALNAQEIAGAALSSLPPGSSGDRWSDQLRQHPKTIVLPHVTTIIKKQQKDLAIAIANDIVALLESEQKNDALALELVPIDLVTPHEQIDDKRVARLMGRLEEEGRLVNPPISTFWNGRYIILDGATRFTSFQRLGYPTVILQVVDPQQSGFELHTWYHAISHETSAFSELHTALEAIPGLQLSPLDAHDIPSVFQNPQTLCYILDRENQATLVKVAAGADRLAVMNGLVNSYNAWGNVERTLLTDLPRLLAQFPQMQAIAIFPQFKPEEVFDAASRGDFLPAGLTRFVIPGRILRLNAELARLKLDEPLSVKKAWFNQFLAEKLSRSRLRYYQEPVILLDD